MVEEIDGFSEFLESWELDEEDVHPRAKELLQGEFWWDPTEESAPVGNDDGHDAFGNYLEWRQEHPRASATKCITLILRSWDTASDAHWDAVTEAEVKQCLETEDYGVDSRDNALFAVAFGEILLKGSLTPELKQRCQLAIQRQKLPIVLSRWGEGHREERVRRLLQIQVLVEQL